MIKMVFDTVNGVKRLRTERSVTQEELAEHLGISLQAVSKWETGVSLS